MIVADTCSRLFHTYSICIYLYPILSRRQGIIHLDLHYRLPLPGLKTNLRPAHPFMFSSDSFCMIRYSKNVEIAYSKMEITSSHLISYSSPASHGPRGHADRHVARPSSATGASSSRGRGEAPPTPSPLPSPPPGPPHPPTPPGSPLTPHRSGGRGHPSGPGGASSGRVLRG